MTIGDLLDDYNFKQWYDSINEDERNQVRILAAWTENKWPEKPGDLIFVEDHAKSSTDIIDELFEMGHLEINLVAKFMHLAGFKIVKVGGKYKWQYWENEV